jgi:hypothetical protein
MYTRGCTLLPDGIDTNWVVPILLLLSLCLSACLKLGQGSSHGTSLLGPKIQRLKLPLAVVFSQIVVLVLADHSQHSSNRLTHHLAADETDTILNMHTKKYTIAVSVRISRNYVLASYPGRLEKHAKDMVFSQGSTHPVKVLNRFELTSWRALMLYLQ